MNNEESEKYTNYKTQTRDAIKKVHEQMENGKRILALSPAYDTKEELNKMREFSLKEASNHNLVTLEESSFIETDLFEDTHGKHYIIFAGDEKLLKMYKDLKTNKDGLSSEDLGCHLGRYMGMDDNLIALMIGSR